MAFDDARLCLNCVKLDLSAVFDPHRFDGVPHPEGQAWQPYIQVVGRWNPTDRLTREFMTLYPEGIVPGCPFCEILTGVLRESEDHRLRGSGYAGGAKAAELTLLAVASCILLKAVESRNDDEFREKGSESEMRRASSSVFLVVMSSDEFARLSMETRSVGHWRTLLGAHQRHAIGVTGSQVITVASEAVVSTSPDPPPIQGRLFLENRIDFTLVRSWLSFCENQHANCRPPNQPPPVVGMKLIDCHTRQLVAVDPVKNYDYVALSYVWGTRPVKNSTATYPNLPDALPEAILDSINVVGKLGLQYLWVDRYCIWQDDPIHKMAQVSQMDKIYGNACLTIVACAGKDPEYGLPGLSMPRSRHRPIVRTIGSCTLVGKLSHHWQQSLVSASKWATRGWTLQESCLSRRRLYFTDYQASFECHDMCCFEHLTVPLAVNANTASMNPEDRPDWNNVQIPAGIWQILSRYQERQLTDLADRLAAVTGVLSRWMAANSDCYHYWGVPLVAAGWPKGEASVLKRAFLSGLAVQLSRECVKGYRIEDFPSWSWVGVGGKLDSWNGWSVDGKVKETAYMDAEVGIERPDGSIIDLESFRDEGGFSRSPSDWTPYLHMECWSFKIGPFQRHTLRGLRPARANLFFFPIEGTETSESKAGDLTGCFLVLSPDAGHSPPQTLFEAEFEAISFSPLEHSNFALVLNKKGKGVWERVGFLQLSIMELVGEMTFEKVSPCRRSDMAKVQDVFDVQRRRVKLG